MLIYNTKFQRKKKNIYNKLYTLLFQSIALDFQAFTMLLIKYTIYKLNKSNLHTIRVLQYKKKNIIK